MQEEYMESEVELWIQDYKEGLGQFEEKLPSIARSYMDFTGACFAAGDIDQKMKQLMALGISLYAQDEYCIVYHTNEAIHHGATEQEILEVIGVCAAIGGGAVMSQGVTLVQDCLAQLNTKH
ncbi:carboxymuconolactone decarboxylase family protein [Bacillus horti]|uniref:AhpD family alkylhydroperoxidase n=1 Tax=Caldalkalibacillus horti TaxID=77523 RepID=A0ABT9VTX4_9BACI|nr:carboxymuconolactone decarboxylase family protein [Bacillus horti]MDQ0164438.1 AhpD family alkylhydroperoxidase [Bacillus horti]